MIWTVARREFFDLLKSLRFLIGLLVTVALSAITTAISVSDYAQRLQDYSAARQDIKGDPFYVRLYRAPEPLSVLVQGKDRSLGNLTQMTPMDIPVKTSGYMGEYLSQHHRFVSGFEAIDFAFIVRVVLSLIVIFLVYNAVAGEKSSGTLKLALANSVPRQTVVLGKLLGGMGTMLVSLTAATLVALLVIQLHAAFSVQAEDWGRIGIIFVFSALYLTAFFTLGLMVSVMVNRPATALAILLQAWIFLIVIYPNIAVVASRQMASVPPEEEINYRKRATQSEFDPRLKAIHEEMQGGYSPELMSRWTDVMAEDAEAKHRIDMELANSQREQGRIAAMLLSISPASLYDRSAARLARTGMDQHDRFLDAAGRYWHEYIEATKARWLARANRSEVKMPQFSFQPEPASESLAAALPDLLVLALMSLVFFAFSTTLFSRKDVR